MLEYIMWIKTKMTLSSGTFFHNDQKVPVEVADAEEGRHDLLYATWIRQAFVQSWNQIALTSVSKERLR